MDIIINFYKQLDILNLILFWGIIVVITLLLVFAVVISKKNKKLQEIINTNNKIEIANQIPIKDNILENISKDYNKNSKKTNILQNKEHKIEEKNFVVEEHIMEYNNHNESNQKIDNEIKMQTQQKAEENNYEKTNDKNITTAYKANILKQISSNQTSPIGIMNIEERKSNSKNVGDLFKSNEKEIKKLSHSNMKNDFETKNRINEEQKFTNVSIANSNKILTNKTNDIINNKRDSGYMEKLSKKIKESEKENINRTNYELKQEEDAIISYKELMAKKDKIKIEEDEDVVISIEELLNIKQEKNNYNSENDKFIDELKKFRKELH